MPALAYDDSVYLKACEAIANGSLIAQACAEAGCTRKALWEWSRRSQANGDVYARVRLESAMMLEEEILETARDCTPSTYNADRVKIDSLKWLAAKRHPKVYGDKVDITSNGQTVAAAVVLMPPEQIPEGEYEVLEPTAQPLIEGADVHTP